MMANRVLCRYFVHGACNKGDSCPFSHSWNDQPSTVCTFYQRGVCSFGDKCRYDHVKVSRPGPSGSRDGVVTSGHPPYAGSQAVAAGSISQSPHVSSSGPSYGSAGATTGLPASMLSVNLGGAGGAPGGNQSVPPVGPNDGPMPMANPYAPGPPPGRALANLTPLGLTSSRDLGEYNLPASLDSPYGPSSAQNEWFGSSRDWDFDEGLPEGAFDDEGIPDDEFEDFQREAAEFAAKGAALRQGLAEISFHDRPSSLGGASPGPDPRVSGHQESGGLTGQPGTYTPASAGSNSGPGLVSTLNPNAGSYHFWPSRSLASSTPTSMPHPNSNLGPRPTSSTPGNSWAWGGAHGSPAEKDLQSKGEEVGGGKVGPIPEGKPTTSEKPEDRPICAFAAAGNCPEGDTCEQLHGDTCPTCGKQCLHPFRPQERGEHESSCGRNQRMLESLRKSQEIECSICLERVLAKPKISERKFGVLSGCDHPFCIACIRNWRGGNHPVGMDLETVVRTCPVCRVLTHYVTPSVVWYFSPEEKEEVVKGYKKRINDIDCKHFDYGNGKCPFGTSCFYKHAYPDGTREEIKLRHLGAADGSTVIQKDIRLSDFLAASIVSRR